MNRGIDPTARTFWTGEKAPGPSGCPAEATIEGKTSVVLHRETYICGSYSAVLGSAMDGIVPTEEIGRGSTFQALRCLVRVQSDTYDRHRFLGLSTFIGGSGTVKTSDTTAGRSPLASRLAFESTRLTLTPAESSPSVFA